MAACKTGKFADSKRSRNGKHKNCWKISNYAENQAHAFTDLSQDRLMIAAKGH
jgi:hypothetical protein